MPKIRPYKINFKNEADLNDPAEILMYEGIGQDPWDGSGMSASRFKATLDSIPRNKPLNVRINSPGGDVWDGMAIKNLFDAWPGKKTAIVDGVAASVASWAFMDADEFLMNKNSQMFIHDAWGMCMGNAADMESVSDQLDKTSDQIASMYADKSGKSKKSMRDLMLNGQLLTAAECEEMGLIDGLTEAVAVSNFTNEQVSKMRDRLAHNTAQPIKNAVETAKNAKEYIMNRDQLIAMLNKLAITFDNKASDADLAKLLNDYKPATTTPATQNVIDLTNELAAMKTQLSGYAELNNRDKTDRLTRAVDQLVIDDKIPLSSRDATLALVLKDETAMAVFNAMPPTPPGHPGLKPLVGVIGDSLDSIQSYVGERTWNFTKKFIGNKTDGTLGPKMVAEITNRAIEAYNAISKNKEKIIGMWNTNNIDAGLQRQVILMDLLRAFEQRILVLTAFCKTFNSVPLEGTDKIDVPYFPLQTAASTDWVAATGYVAGDTTENTREITVNKRKYQCMAFTSQELRRQPYQNWAQLAIMNGEKLATDVDLDVMSVITAANFGAASLTIPAAAFNSDNVVDLEVVATDVNWPMTSRSLVLTSSYYGSLLKDPAFKSALAYGSSDPIQMARIANAYGFQNIFNMPASLLPANGENLVGWINHLNAVLVATSPIMPTPDVRAVMTQYDVMVSPTLGIALEYRRFGNAQLDKTLEAVECNYGFTKGIDAALKRITSA